MAIIHATGAIVIFVFGIVYLRSRRLFIIMSMYEHQYKCEDREEVYQKIEFKVDKENSKNQNNSNLFHINEEENESSNEDEQEYEVNDYLLWSIYMIRLLMRSHQSLLFPIFYDLVYDFGFFDTTDFNLLLL